MMKKKGWFLLLAMLLVCGIGSLAAAQEQPVTAEEIRTLAAEARERVRGEDLLNNPASEEAASEDGIAFMYPLGTLYGDTAELTDDTQIVAMLLMEEELRSLRGIGVTSSVSDVMAAIPCENEEMAGTYEAAVLYLTGEGDAWQYGRVLRDGQRISAMEYGAVDEAAGTRLAVVFQISGDGVTAIRVEGLTGRESPEALSALRQELEKIRTRAWYTRVKVSYNGAELEPFNEADLDFSALSYRTAEPSVFSGEVEDILMDNGDGTFLRRIDGDGFEAVFTCDQEGKQARLVSYSILGEALEGPRCVRLGDYFQEDFNRFRNGEGAYNETAGTEVLYGIVGEGSYGLAEYGTHEMVLRYVTVTLDGAEVELYLHYTDTRLDEIILYTLE